MEKKSKTSERLKQLRLEKELTQEELGKIIGMTKQSVYNYENGKRKCDEESLIKLAEFFNVSVDYLIGHETIRKSYLSTLSIKQKRILELSGCLNDNQLTLLEQVILEFIKNK